MASPACRAACWPCGRCECNARAAASPLGARSPAPRRPGRPAATRTSRRGLRRRRRRLSRAATPTPPSASSRAPSSRATARRGRRAPPAAPAALSPSSGRQSSSHPWSSHCCSSPRAAGPVATRSQLTLASFLPITGRSHALFARFHPPGPPCARQRQHGPRPRGAFRVLPLLAALPLPREQARAAADESPPAQAWRREGARIP